ncbi:MAG: hypothetical protein AL399_04365 [Candidatus [Bacteroides] periocalifornicus]|uniref:DNA 3'-5' helicase n=1 Tax=Candidatus [Bacteroides] periocalifornicus TaxID=1702214 RepID=A0A0Q4B9B7_9BACT|nr:MAG: hypothetical protein AL399_04365 [Candidatus [Bacteroides] periocalifornicus]
MASLKLYDASAGSGKTHTLVLEYLTHLLADSAAPSADSPTTPWMPTRYASTLCVTFTNKATAELKSRIVGTLYSLVKAESSPMLPDLAAATGLGVATLRARAARCLKAILHHYSQLGVSTIDSFVERMGKSLFWEIGVPGDTRVMLDQERLIDDGIVRLLSNLDPESAIFSWIRTLILENLENGQPWHLVPAVQKRAQQLFQPVFQLMAPEKRAEFFSPTLLVPLRKYLTETAREALNSLKQQAEVLENLRLQFGIATDVFSYSSNGTSHWDKSVAKVLAHTEGDLPELGSRAIAACHDGELWFAKSIQGRSALIGIVEQHLLTPYREFIVSYIRLCALYCTATRTRNLLPHLGMLHDLRECINTAELEQHSLLLADTTSLLVALSGGDDLSFVYEKMGTRYDSLLIDEFQDTSRLHWRLLAPLVHNSLAQGGISLLVGDVKQAIYRWRGGDWQLLARDIPEEFARVFGIDKHVLEYNYRSSPSVVKFNNQLFSKALENLIAFCAEKANKAYPPEYEAIEAYPELKRAVDQTLSQFTTTLRAAYEGLQQKSPREDVDAGHVELLLAKEPEVSPLENATAEEERAISQAVVELTLQQIDHLIDTEGLAPSDIAILVRRSKSAVPIANAILAHNTQRANKYGVVSQEALLLDLSPNVQFMLAALRAVAGVHSHVDTALIARHLDSLQGFSPLEWASRLMGLSPRKASHQSPQLSPSTSRHDCTPPKPHNSMVDSTLAWLRRLRSLPILEAFDAIAEGLKLPTSPGELPYLSALRDMVHSFPSEQGSTLAAFIQRYQEQDASKRMLPLSQSSSSVNVLTIHKAKGLEFKAVICPEVDWDIIALPSLQTEIIWAPPVGPELENLLLPTRLSLGNGNSNSPLHAPAVLEEHCLAGADALNLLYVAFTRAKDWLSIIYAPKGKKTEKSSVKSTQAGKKTNGRTYTQLLESALAAIGWDCEEEADTHVKYSLGRFSATPSAPSDTPIAIRPPSREERPLFATTPLPIRISIPERNTLEYEQATRRRAARTLGESLHALLQAANKAEDIAAGIAALSASGMLKPEAASQLIATIGQMAGEPPLAHLFSGDYTAIAERDILAQDGQTHRPDRIAISESETLVVDFKFGRPQASHSRQVARYCQLLQELGYARPQGYLWYLRPDTGQGALVEVPATP